MQTRLLPGTDIRVSRFAFGTASLHHLRTERERRKLLAAAVSRGFTHFDTSPLYGFGEAERSLAPILAAHPDLTVATKVGLYPPGGGQPRLLMLGRKLAGRCFPTLSRAIIDWRVEQARASLTASLARLCRDRADILFLHEPDFALISTDEWRRWLEDESRCRVRSFGVAGSIQGILPFVEERSPFATVIQTLDSIAGRQADPILLSGRPLQITYGYLSSVRKTSAWDAERILVEALNRNTTGAILVSTRKFARLDQFASASIQVDALTGNPNALDPRSQ